jgi:hypothetical protein
MERVNKNRDVVLSDLLSGRIDLREVLHSDTTDKFLVRIEDGAQWLNLYDSESCAECNPQKPAQSDPKKPATKPHSETVLGAELSLLELIAGDVLEPNKRTGRPQAPTEAENDHLCATVKQNFKTRRMGRVDVRGKQVSIMSAMLRC